MRTQPNRRIILTLIAFCLLLSGFFGRVRAEGSEWMGEYEGLNYVSLGGSNVAVHGFAGAAPPERLIIPRTATLDGGEYTVAAIAERAPRLPP